MITGGPEPGPVEPDPLEPVPMLTEPLEAKLIWQLGESSANTMVSSTWPSKCNTLASQPCRDSIMSTQSLLVCVRKIVA